MTEPPVLHVANRTIGRNRPVFIVAELSGNHHQDFDEAVELVRAAHAAGADAVKLQTYTPDTITMDSRKPWFLVGGEGNPADWQKKSLYELYQTAYTPWDWQPKLKKLADELGMLLFSTPFDETAVDFLEKMAVPCYKVASYELNDVLLLRKIAKTGKPVIMSVGYASLDDIELAVKTLRKYGTKELAILYCVTGYTLKPNLAAMNLATIRDLVQRFNVVVGFSDNHGGIDVPVQAVLAGASIIEKHLILDRTLAGPDARFSIEPDELGRMIEKIRKNESIGKKKQCDSKLLGQPHYGPGSELERYNLRFRRSLFAVENIKKGETFTAKNIRSIRPSDGLHTKFFDKLITKKAKKDIEKGTPLSWDLVQKQ